VLLALPFRYRYKINWIYEVATGRSRTPSGATYYEFVDERCQLVHSSPDQDLMLAWEPVRTGVNGMRLQPRVQPLELDRARADIPERWVDRKVCDYIGQTYMTLYFMIRRQQGLLPGLDPDQQPDNSKSNKLTGSE
jgi:hypothetical protein